MMSDDVLFEAAGNNPFTAVKAAVAPLYAATKQLRALYDKLEDALGYDGAKSINVKLSKWEDKVGKDVAKLAAQHFAPVKKYDSWLVDDFTRYVTYIIEGDSGYGAGEKWGDLVRAIDDINDKKGKSLPLPKLEAEAAKIVNGFVKALAAYAKETGAAISEDVAANSGKVKELQAKKTAEKAAASKEFTAAHAKVMDKIGDLVDAATAALMSDPRIMQMLSSRSLDDAAYDRLLKLQEKIPALHALEASGVSSLPGKPNAKSIRSRFMLYFRDLTEQAKERPEYGVPKFNEFIKNLQALPAALEKIPAFLEKELEKVAKHAEAPPKAPLGQIAFPAQRKGKPLEPDTKTEAELYAALERHFGDNIPLKPEDAAMLRAMLAKGWYSDVIKEPTTEIVVRGMGVDAGWLKKALKTTKIPPNGEMEKSFTFTPRKGSSSWSTSTSVAKGFTGSGQYDVILYAKVEQNPKRFLAGPGGLYKVSGLDTFPEEKEAVGLGPIKVFKVSWRSSW